HVSVKQPTLEPTESGGDPVAFIFNHVMENGLHYLNIAPDKEEEVAHVETISFPDVIEKEVDVAQEELEALGFEVDVIGQGETVARANIQTGEDILTSQRIFIITEEPTIPNLRGWSQKDVAMLANMLELEINITGQGYVENQSVDPETEITEDMVIEVELKEPGGSTEDET